MTPYTQLIQHDPEYGVYGDCYRTCIGCLLDIQPIEIPHFYKDKEYGDSIDVDYDVRMWLKPRNLHLLTTSIRDTIEDFLDYMKTFNCAQHYILLGGTPSNIPHAVVCRGGEIIHDPAPSNPGVTQPLDDGLYWADFITKC